MKYCLLFIHSTFDPVGGYLFSIIYYFSTKDLFLSLRYFFNKFLKLIIVRKKVKFTKYIFIWVNIKY